MSRFGEPDTDGLQPEEHDEQDDRDFMANRLRCLRAQRTVYGPSSVTTALLLEASRRASLLQCFRRVDRSSQKAGL